MAKQNPQMNRGNTTQAQRQGGAGKSPAKSAQGSSQLSRGAARRRAAQQPWWKGSAPIIVTIATVAALIGLFVFISRQGGSSVGGIGDPVPATVLQAVTQPDPTIFAKVGTGGLKSPQIPISAPVLKGPNGKPEVFYYGSEFCPYCAAQRWSLIMAMSRFGEYKDLRLMKSGDAPEAFPQTNTFTFQHSAYTSQYLDWASVEGADRNGQPLQTPTADQQQIVNTYDAPPYTQTAGAIPFITYANQYTTIGAGFQNSSIQDLTWQQIASKLSDPNDPVTKNIVGNANYMTAAICQSTNQQPASVCQAAPIPDIEKQITQK
jgi:hypothetical protein